MWRYGRNNTLLSWGHRVPKKWNNQPSFISTNIYLWILWQTGGSYSIISHFTKYSEKTITNPLKMQSVQISYSTHFDACCLQLENGVCTESNARAWSREGQRATYFDSNRDAGRLSTFSFLGQKRDEESTRLFKLSSGCNAQMGQNFRRVYSFLFFVFHCILKLFKNQAFTRKKKKTRVGYIEQIYRQASRLANFMNSAFIYICPF